MVHLNVEMHNTRNSEDIVYSLWKHKVLRDIDKLYFLRREYVIKNIDDDNYRVWNNIWKGYQEGTPTLKRFAEIAEKLYNDNNAKPFKADKASDRAKVKETKGYLKGTNGEKIKHLVRFDKHDFWKEALDALKEEAKTNNDYDLSEIPTSSKEAFAEFMQSPEGASFFELEEPIFDENHPLVNQPRWVRNNEIFNFAQARLEDKDTFHERYTPGGFYNMKAGKAVQFVLNYGTEKELKYIVGVSSANDLKMLFSEEEIKMLDKAKSPSERLTALSKTKKYQEFVPNYNSSELSTIAHFHTKNAIYDKLIGIAANQSINQRYTSLLNSLALNRKISFGSIINCNDGAGISVSKKMLNGEDTELIVIEFLAAAVDAVKDALLEYYGMDDNNFNLACLMAKIGATPTDIGLLLNQPVVRMALNIMNNSEYNMSFNTALGQALEEIGSILSIDDYNTEKNALDRLFSDKNNGDDERSKYLTQDKLISNIAQFNRDTNNRFSFAGGHNADIDFLKNQIAVVHVLKELNDASTEFSSQVNASKGTSVNTFKSNFGASESYIDKCETTCKKFGNPEKGSMFNMQIVSTGLDSDGDNTIIDTSLRLMKSDEKGTTTYEEEILLKGMQSAYCMEQGVYSSFLSFVEEIINKYFPYRGEGYMQLKNDLKALTSTGELNTEIYDACNKEIQMFVLERVHPMFRGERITASILLKGERKEIPVTNRQFYTLFFPEYFARAIHQYPELEEFDLIKALKPRQIKSGSVNTSSVLEFNNLIALGSEYKDLYIESWENMFSSSNPLVRDMALHLFMYSYFNSGFDFARTSVMSLAPLAIKEALESEKERIGYTDVINEMLFNLKKSKNAFCIEANNITLSRKDFCQAFIKNHQEFYQFRTIVPYKSELRTYIDNHSQNGIITLDFSDGTVASNKALLSQVAVYDGDKYKFTPMLVIGDELYMCGISAEDALDSKDPAFNTSSTATMTYYKIESPLGKCDYDKVKTVGGLTQDAQEAILKMKKLLLEVASDEVPRKPSSSTELDNNAYDGSGIDNINADKEDYKIALQEMFKPLKTLSDAVSIIDKSLINLILALINNVSKIDSEFINSLKLLKEKIMSDLIQKIPTNGENSEFKAILVKELLRNFENLLGVCDRNLKKTGSSYELESLNFRNEEFDKDTEDILVFLQILYADVKESLSEEKDKELNSCINDIINARNTISRMLAPENTPKPYTGIRLWEKFSSNLRHTILSIDSKLLNKEYDINGGLYALADLINAVTVKIQEYANNIYDKLAILENKKEQDLC